MDEFLISTRKTRRGRKELRSLIDRLDAAIPDAEPVKDERRVASLTFGSSASAYEEPSPDDPRVALRLEDAASLVRHHDLASLVRHDDIVSLVLPAVAGVTVEAVVDAAVDWLWGLHVKPARGETAVLIYGPNGGPVRKIRLSAGETEPEVFAPPWPLPPLWWHEPIRGAGDSP